MKSSSVAFLGIMFSLLILSSFISAFPEGINMAEKHEIEYDGDSILFYGGMEGKGEIEMYATNCSVGLNGMVYNASRVIFKGKGNFHTPSTLFISFLSLCRKADINGSGYANIDGNEFYGLVKMSVKGKIAINFTEASIKFVRGNETLPTFLKNMKIEEEDVDKIIFLLNFLPLSIDSVFLLNGSKGSIDGMPSPIYKAIFRGGGNYSEGHFKGETYLLINNKKFFENERKIKIGIFYIPYKIIMLWVIAISIFIASLFIKKEEREFDKSLSPLSAIASILMIGITFYLWEKQAFIIFGTDFLKILLHPSTSSIISITLITTAYLEFLAFIGFPVRITISSIFSFFGLHNIGKISGKVAGYAIAIFLGINMLPAILNMVFRPLLGLI